MNQLIAYILYFMASIGLTEILIRSKLLEPVRKSKHILFTCYQCSGFWCGLTLSLLITGYWPWQLEQEFSFLGALSSSLILILHGLACAFLIPFVQQIEEYLENKNFKQD